VVKDTDEFTLNMYADSALTKIVATGSDLFVDSTALSPAAITLTSFKADVTGVQE